MYLFCGGPSMCIEICFFHCARPQLRDSDYQRLIATHNRVNKMGQGLSSQHLAVVTPQRKLHLLLLPESQSHRPCYSPSHPSPELLSQRRHGLWSAPGLPFEFIRLFRKGSDAFLNNLERLEVGFTKRLD